MATVSYVLSTNVSPNFTDNINELGNGILKVTQFADPVSYAAITIAVAGVDYQAASSNLTSLAAITPAQGGLIAGMGSGWELLGFGSALVGDVLTITDAGDTGIGWSTPTGGTVDSITFTSTGATINITGTNPVLTTGTVNLDIATVSIAKGGTGQSTATNAFNALSPATTAGDTIWYNGTNNVRLAGGTTGQVLTVTGTGPITLGWSTNGAGSVTSVAASSSSGVLISGSPITSAGTITINLDGTGVSNAVVQGDMLVGNGAGSYIGVALGTTGQVLTSNGTTAAWATAPGTGTVTSVGVTSSDLTVGGSPITTSGTITLSLNTVAVAKGGTHFTSYTTGDMLYASGSTAFSKLNIGSIHNVLVSTGTAPDWVADSPNAGQVLTFNGSAIIWDDTGSSIVGLTSTSGILITGSGSDTLTVNLDGTGTSNAVAVGDILVGTTGSPNTYQAIAIGVSGQVLRVSAGGSAEWASVAGTGTVTSVGLTSTGSSITITGTSPITSSGTYNIEIATVSAAHGGTGQTSYTTGDMIYASGATAISKLALSGTAHQVLTNDGSTAPAWSGGAATSGNVLTYNGTNIVWAVPATSGTVTSVAAASTTGILVTGSPITSSGTLTLNLTGSGVANAVAVGDLLLGGSSTYAALAIGASGRVLTSNGTTASWDAPATSGTVTSVAATSTDLTITGSPITSSGTLDFTLNTVQTGKGGTGLTTYTAGDTVYYAAGTLLSKLAIGAANTVMTSSGTTPQWVGGSAASGNVLTFNGTNVVWEAPATSGTVTSVGVSSSTGIIVGSTPVTSSGTITVNLPGSGGSSAVVAGDLLLGGSGSYAALAHGTNGQVLTSNGTTATWATLADNFPSYFNPSTFILGTNNWTDLSPQGDVVLINQSGSNVLPNATSIGNGILIGSRAENATSYNRNIFIGTNTTHNLIGGSQNCVVGYNSGNGIINGNSNTLFGDSSGPFFEGSQNICIGQGVGFKSQYTQCVLIGAFGTDTIADNQTGAVAIGVGATANSGGIALGNNTTAQANTAIIGGGSLTALGVGATAPSYGVTLGSSSLGGFFTPQSSSKTVSGNGGVFWVDSSNNPKFTNSTASYTLATSDSLFSWNTVSGTAQTLASNKGYICTNVAQTTGTLPATASVGDTYEISAYTAAGWTLVPGTATQIIRMGNAATTASTGSLTSTQIGDSLKIVCMNATTPGSEVFVVTSSMGNITVV